MLDVIEIEVTRTADGQFDYVQIRSPAAMPVNIVLVAGKIIVNDRRGGGQLVTPRIPGATRSESGRVQ